MTSTDARGPRVWQLFLVFGFVAATVAVWREPTFTRPEQLVVLSLACIAAAVVAVAVHRTLLPLVAPERLAGDSRRGERALVALEREKRLVLRSIKELEFDRAMGKVADADFDDMSGRLRERALGLLQRIERGQQGLRARIEADLHRGVDSRRRPSQAPTPAAAADTTARACGACATVNDGDARFCKHCGAAL